MTGAVDCPAWCDTTHRNEDPEAPHRVLVGTFEHADDACCVSVEQERKSPSPLVLLSPRDLQDDVELTSAQARELAAHLVHAADLAEGLRWAIATTDNESLTGDVQRPAGMRLRVVDQEPEAQVVIGDDGRAALVCRPGLLSPRAFVALGLALAGQPVVAPGSV